MAPYGGELHRDPAYPRQRPCDETPDRASEMLPWTMNWYTPRRINPHRRTNPTRAFKGLWRHGDFVRLWGSLTITHFGGQVTHRAAQLTCRPPGEGPQRRDTCGGRRAAAP